MHMHVPGIYGVCVRFICVCKMIEMSLAEKMLIILDACSAPNGYMNIFRTSQNDLILLQMYAIYRYGMPYNEIIRSSTTTNIFGISFFFVDLLSSVDLASNTSKCHQNICVVPDASLCKFELAQSFTSVPSPLHPQKYFPQFIQP